MVAIIFISQIKNLRHDQEVIEQNTDPHGHDHILSIISKFLSSDVANLC